jgi:DNA-binding response OmpR family regulator
MAYMKLELILIEDDRLLREMIELILTRAQFEFKSFASAEAYLANKKLASNSIYIIDLNLPGISGKELIKQIRSINHLAYILIISGDHTEDDINLGFYSGADDYLVKPFRDSHLLSRLYAAKAKLESFSKVNINDGIKFIPEGYVISSYGTRISVTEKEFHILKNLYAKVGQAVSKETIGQDQTTDYQIHLLRKKIPAINWKILNVRGVGYKLIEHQR